jgi:hypothetical protein
MIFFQEMIGGTKVKIRADDVHHNQHNNANKNEARSSPTKNFVPFKSFSKYPVDPYIFEVVSMINIKADQIRSSDKLKLLLANILQNCSINTLHHTDQFVKVRLDALMKLLVTQLCIPPLMTFFGVGITVTTGISSESDHERLTVEQKVGEIIADTFSLLKYSESFIRQNSKSHFIKFILTSLCCVCQLESDVALDTNRVCLFVELMRFRSTPLLPQSLTVKESAPFVLELLARHLLSVTALTESISQSIKLVVVRLSNTLNNEMRSCTVDERLVDIQLIVADFLSWLRVNADQLVRLCRREEIVHSVDGSVRAWLKGECYSSPAELVSVYQQKYMSALTHMGIPLQPFKARDVEQALKDLVRETVSLNRVEYRGGVCAGSLNAGGESSSLSHQQLQQQSSVVDDLLGIAAAQQRVLTPGSDRDDIHDALIPLHRAIRRELRKVLAFSFGVDGGGQGWDSPPVEHDDGATDDSLSDGDSSNGSSETHSRSFNGAIRSRRAVGGRLDGVVEESGSWQSALLEELCTYTLLAASRTFAAGDAFWILSDLYGGEGLALCPVDGVQQQRLTVGGGHPITPPRSRSGSLLRTPTFSPSSAAAREPPAAAMIAITASGVKVTLRERYGLYLVRDLEACTTDRGNLQPLGRFECTTTTLILLAPEAVVGAVQQQQTPSKRHLSDELLLGEEEDGVDKLAACRLLYKTLFVNPDLVCHRAVSIEPYL